MSISDLYQIPEAWGRPAQQAARAARPRRKTTNWVVISGQNAVVWNICNRCNATKFWQSTLVLALHIQGWRCFNSAWSTWDTISKMRQQITSRIHVFWVQLHQLTLQTSFCLQPWSYSRNQKFHVNPESIWKYDIINHNHIGGAKHIRYIHHGNTKIWTCARHVQGGRAQDWRRVGPEAPRRPP